MVQVVRGGILIDRQAPSIQEPGTPPPALPRVEGTFRALLRWAAVILIVILIASLSLALWYSSYLGQPYEVGAVATGEQTVLLPLMTYYSLPSVGPRGTSETYVTFTNATFFDFAWGNVSGADLPVHFTIRRNATATAVFEPGAPDGFRVWPSPNGTESFGLGVGNLQGVYVLDCVLNYTIRRMARQVGFGSESWLDVDYVVWSNITELSNLPYAGVSLPSAADLGPAGNETVGLTGPWQLQRSLANFTKPAAPFRNTVGPIVLSLGSAGNLTAELTSSFTWGPNDNYEISLSDRRDTTLALTWYWDMRFGSLIAM